jgi:hypothetical protein
LLTDQVRSTLSSGVRSFNIEKFYTDAETIIREIILGPDGAGMAFPENGMRVYAVDVLSIVATNAAIAKQIGDSQVAAVTDHLSVAAARRSSQIATAKLEIEIDTERATTKNHTYKQELKRERDDATHVGQLDEYTKKKARLAQDREVQAITDDNEDAKQKARTERIRLEAESSRLITEATNLVENARLRGETDEVIRRFEALASSNFIEALLALKRDDVMETLAEAANMQAILGGANLVDVLGNLAQKTGLQEYLANLATKALTKQAQNRQQSAA